MTIDNSDSINHNDHNSHNDNQDEHVLNFDYEQSNQIEQQQEQRCLKNDHQDDVEEEIVTTKQIGMYYVLFIMFSKKNELNAFVLFNVFFPH